jgi:hypothetical protein
VSPEKVYIMNERNIQGVSPIMTQVNGAYLPDTYWLSSTRRSGALFRVSQSSSAKAWYADESGFPWTPEGMHATASGTNLWVATEGRRDSSGNIINNPATGGARGYLCRPKFRRLGAQAKVRCSVARRSNCGADVAAALPCYGERFADASDLATARKHTPPHLSIKCPARHTV